MTNLLYLTSEVIIKRERKRREKRLRGERKTERERQRVRGGRRTGREKQTEFRLPDRAVWSSPSETLHRHCETSRESQRVRADMTV